MELPRYRHISETGRRIALVGTVLAVGIAVVVVQSRIADALFSSIPEDIGIATDGSVYAIAEGADGTIYFGGEFSTVGVPSTNVAFWDAEGVFQSGFPGVNGDVSAVAPDGEGGWFIGGSFTEVGGVERANVAHILSDGTVDSEFDVSTDDSVTAVAVSEDGETLYIGGDFGSVNGDDCPCYLAAIDVATGDYDTAFPNPNSSVNALLVSGTTLYVGGDFDELGGEDYPYLGAVDLSTGEVAAFGPKPDDSVYSLALSSDGETIYAGGNFLTVNTDLNCVGQYDPNTEYERQEYDPDTDALTGSPESVSISSGNDWRDIIPGEDGRYLTRPPIPEGMSSLAGLRGEEDGQFYFTDQVCSQTVEDYTIPDDFTERQNNPGVPADVCVVSAVSGKFYNLHITTWETAAATCGAERQYLAAFDTGTGEATAFNAAPDGAVFALAVSDDDQTVYAGGQFEEIGGGSHQYLASLDAATGEANDFDGGLDNSVNAVALGASGDTVYIGGNFTAVNGGEPAQGLAALDAETGELTDSVRGTDGSVAEIVVLPTGEIAVGGSFTLAEAQLRGNVAAYDPESEEITDFSPNTDGTVNALAVGGSTLYIGGDFTEVDGGTTRNYIAAYDTLTGLLSEEFNPSPDGPVLAFALSATGETLYVGGDFTEIAAEERGYVAALNASDGTLITAFEADADNAVAALELSGDGTTVFLGGYFTDHLAGVSAATGEPSLTFTATADGTVHALALSPDGTTLYAGGEFASVGGEDRNRVAALTVADGAVTDFDPDVAGASVYAIGAGEDAVTIGGLFSTIAGTSRDNLAMVTTDGMLRSFNPEPDEQVRALMLSGLDGALWVGGQFTEMTTGAAKSVAAFSDIGADLTPPEVELIGSDFMELACGDAFVDTGATATDTVDGDLTDSIVASGSVDIYTADTYEIHYTVTDFSDNSGSATRTVVIGACPEGELALSNMPDDDSVETNGNVTSLVAVGDKLYMAGDFTRVGTKRRHFAPFSLDSGEPTGIIARTDCIGCGVDYLYDASPDGSGGWYIGGKFDSIGGEDIGYLAHILPDGTVDADFAPVIDGEVLSVLASGSAVYFTGNFSTVGEEFRLGAAAVDAETGAVLPFNPATSNTPMDMELRGDVVYLVGSFTDVNRPGQFIAGTAKLYAAAFDADTGALIPAWAPNPDGWVYDIELGPDSAFLAGSFSTLDGSPPARLGEVDLTTGTATSFDADVGSTVSALAYDDGTLYFSGTFTTVDATARNYGAAVDADDGSLLPFDPDLNGNADTILVAGGKVYIQGSIALVNGSVSRNGVAAFDPSTGVVDDWDPDVDDLVLGIAADEDEVAVLGRFVMAQGTPRTNIAVLDRYTRELDAATVDIGDIDMVRSLVYDPVRDHLLIVGNGGFGFGTNAGYIKKMDLETYATTDFGSIATHSIGHFSEAVLTDRTLYLTGFFTEIFGSTDHEGLAALDADAETLLPWPAALYLEPGEGYGGRALAVTDDAVYVGGSFIYTAEAETRGGLAAFDRDTGELLPFDPFPSIYGGNNIIDLLLEDDSLFVSGQFNDELYGEDQPYLAKLDISAGPLADASLDSEFRPDVEWRVYSLARAGSRLFIGGGFENVNGSARDGVASLNAEDGSLGAFAPIGHASPHVFYVDGSVFYIGGPYSPATQQPE